MEGIQTHKHFPTPSLNTPDVSAMDPALNVSITPDGIKHINQTPCPLPGDNFEVSAWCKRTHFKLFMLRASP
jgi:hypothetical protein